MNDRERPSFVHSFRFTFLVLFLRATVWTVLFPGVAAGYIPWQYFGLGDAPVSGVGDVSGLVLIGTGAFVLLSSIVEFARRGNGTLSPVDPPTRLVIAGPFRWLRNPMYTGVLLVLAGEALVSAEPGLVVYAIIFFVLTNAFVARFEEPYLERVFGPAYVDYKANVRRWIPRASPWYRDEKAIADEDHETSARWRT